jgi:hypothetical protein
LRMIDKATFLSGIFKWSYFILQMFNILTQHIVATILPLGMPPSFPRRISNITHFRKYVKDWQWSEVSYSPYRSHSYDTTLKVKFDTHSTNNQLSSFNTCVNWFPCYWNYVWHNLKLFKPFF